MADSFFSDEQPSGGQQSFFSDEKQTSTSTPDFDSLPPAQKAAWALASKHAYSAIPATYEPLTEQDLADQMKNAQVGKPPSMKPEILAKDDMSAGGTGPDRPKYSSVEDKQAQRQKIAHDLYQKYLPLAQKDSTGYGRAALTGAEQGVSLGMAPKIAGAADYLGENILGKGTPGVYERSKLATELQNEVSSAAHPYLHGAAEFGGAMLIPFPGSAEAGVGERAGSAALRGGAEDAVTRALLQGAKTGALAGGISGVANQDYDADSVLKNIARGVGGAASGAVPGAILGSSIGAVAGSVAPGLAERAERKAIDDLSGGRLGPARKLAVKEELPITDLGREALNKELLTETPEGNLVKAREAVQDQGRKMANIAKEADLGGAAVSGKDLMAAAKDVAQARSGPQANMSPVTPGSNGTFIVNAPKMGNAAAAPSAQKALDIVSSMLKNAYPTDQMVGDASATLASALKVTPDAAKAALSDAFKGGAPGTAEELRDGVQMAIDKLAPPTKLLLPPGTQPSNAGLADTVVNKWSPDKAAYSPSTAWEIRKHLDAEVYGAKGSQDRNRNYETQILSGIRQQVANKIQAAIEATGNGKGEAWQAANDLYRKLGVLEDIAEKTAGRAPRASSGLGDQLGVLKGEAMFGKPGAILTQAGEGIKGLAESPKTLDYLAAKAQTAPFSGAAGEAMGTPSDKEKAALYQYLQSKGKGYADGGVVGLGDDRPLPPFNTQGMTNLLPEIYRNLVKYAPLLPQEFSEDPAGTVGGIAGEMGRTQLALPEREANQPMLSGQDVQYYKDHPGALLNAGINVGTLAAGPLLKALAGGEAATTAEAAVPKEVPAPTHNVPLAKLALKRMAAPTESAEAQALAGKIVDKYGSQKGQYLQNSGVAGGARDVTPKQLAVPETPVNTRPPVDWDKLIEDNIRAQAEHAEDYWENPPKRTPDVITPPPPEGVESTTITKVSQAQAILDNPKMPEWAKDTARKWLAKNAPDLPVTPKPGMGEAEDAAQTEILKKALQNIQAKPEAPGMKIGALEQWRAQAAKATATIKNPNASVADRAAATKFLNEVPPPKGSGTKFTSKARGGTVPSPKMALSRLASGKSEVAVPDDGEEPITPGNSAANDRIPVALSGGEGVVSRDDMQDPKKAHAALSRMLKSLKR